MFSCIKYPCGRGSKSYESETLTSHFVKLIFPTKIFRNFFPVNNTLNDGCKKANDQERSKYPILLL